MEASVTHHLAGFCRGCLPACGREVSNESKGQGSEDSAYGFSQPSLDSRILLPGSGGSWLSLEEEATLMEFADWPLPFLKKALFCSMMAMLYFQRQMFWL